MDWTQLGASLLNIGLPALGTLFGGPLGGSVGGIFGKAIAGALGTEATPQAVQQAIAADPDGARIRLAEIEAETKAREAELSDLANARAMEVVAIQAGHEVAWVPVVFSAINYLLVAAILVAVGMGWLREDGILVGWVLGVGTASCQYWLGSSSGSKRNGDAIRAVAQAAAAPVGKAVAGAVTKATKR